MVDRDDKKREPSATREASVPDIDPDAPPSADEVAASECLRDALADPSVPNHDAELARSLRAAFAPAAIAAAAHDDIVDDVPTADELALADELRAALEDLGGGGDNGGDEPDLVRALGAAWRPGEIGKTDHDALVAKATKDLAASNSDNEGAKIIPFARRRAGIAAVATGILALAASVFLFITTSDRSGLRPSAPLARARSTQPLFGEPFKAGDQSKPGDASARIDKIAVARASDYRDNRFRKWGVR